MRSRLARIALVVLAPLLGLELLLRVAGPRVPGVAPLLHDPEIVHRYDEVATLEELLGLSVLEYRPNTRFQDFVLNSRSFRDRERPREKPPGTRRILAIGDSFTFAASVPFEAGWPARLEAELSRGGGERVEVWNLGVPAVGPEFEMRLWEIEGARLDADVVVLAFVVGTNFGASAVARRYRTWPERFAHRVYAVRLVRNAIRLSAARPEGERRDRGGDPAAIPAGAGGVRVAELDPSFDDRYDASRPAMSEEAFDALQKRYLGTCTGAGMDLSFAYAAQTLVRFHREVTASGAEFLVLLCPAELQVNPALLERVAGPEKPPDVDAPQRYLEAAFDREGVPYLDLLPAFRAAGAGEPLYGLRDSHWNPAGNALAARALAERLARPIAGDR